MVPRTTAPGTAGAPCRVALPRVRRWRERARAALVRPARSWWFDAVVASLVLAVLLTDLPGARHPAVAVLFLVGGVLAVALRRVAPRTVVAVAIALWYGGAFAAPDLTLEVVLLVALYTVGAAGARAVSAMAVLVVIGLVSLRLLTSTIDDEQLVFWLVVAVVVAVTGVGLYRGTRRDLVRQWRERAQALEREQERERALAAASERLRIARDMHDVVGHHLTVIVTLAEAAATVLPPSDSPDPAASATAAVKMIAGTGREALAETRRMLGVLRAPHDAPSADAPPADAAADPVLDLIRRVRAAGLTVRSTGREVWAALPADAAAELRAIARESLTNAVKYAGEGAVVEIVLRRTPTGVQLEMIDDGGDPESDRHRPPVSSSGHGVRGMRERLGPWNGSVEAGPTSPRGWRVRADLPHCLPATELLRRW